MVIGAFGGSNRVLTKRRIRSQSGSVFTVLLGGIALTAALGVTTYQLFTGPVSSVVRITQKSLADTQLLSIAKIAIMDATNQAAGGDCDADGFIEPRPWRDTTGNKPANGGLVPLNIGAPVTDPWKSDYGYCVWDVGPLSAQAGCGGGGAGRLDGADNPSAGDIKTQTVMAIISPGPDRQFQTTCNAYVDATTDVITTGGDDYLLRFTYQEAAAATSSLWNLKTGAPQTAEIKKDLEVTAGSGSTGSIIAAGGIKPGTEATVTACAAGTNVGMIRYNTTKKKLETCTGASGWVESGGGSDSFSSDNTVNCAEDLNPADGTPDHRGKVRYNTTSSLPEYCNGVQWLPFTINIPGVNLVISPQQQTGMNVDGNTNQDASVCTVASNLICGAGVTFNVTNSGNTTSGTVAIRLTQVVNGVSSIYTAATLANVANASNFVMTNNTCTTTLAPNAACTLTLRPKANGNMVYTATLTAFINNQPIAIVSGAASNFGCYPGRDGGGGKYAACGLTDPGSGSTYDLIAMPGGCTGSVTNPTCAGGSDTVTKTAAGGCCTSIQCSEFNFLCGEENYGARASVMLAKVATVKGYTFPAVQYCDQMVYNGYSDWYLPARYEMINYLYPNKVAIGGFLNAGYQTSHMGGTNDVGYVNMTNGNADGHYNYTNLNMRCVRRDNIPMPTIPPDTDPDLLGFVPGVTFSSGSRVSSNTLTVTGILDPTTASISGPSGNPQISIAGGGEVSSGSVTIGQTLQLRMDAPTVLGTKNTATLTIGPDTYTWWVGYADSGKSAKIFATSAVYRGDWGGLSGGDAKCTAAAASSSKGLSGDWKVLASDDTTVAAARIPWNWGTLKNLNGDTVSSTGFSGLWSGSLENPVGFDQNGIAMTGQAWTATNTSGGRDPGSFANAIGGVYHGCDNWTYWNTSTGNYNYVSIGQVNSATSAWIKGASYERCAETSSHLYCVENIDSTLDTTPSAINPAYKIQVTASSRQSSDAMVIGGMSAGASTTLSVTATGGTPTFTVNGGGEVTSASVSNGDSVVFLMTAPATASTNNIMTISSSGPTTTLGYWRVWTGAAAPTVKRVFVTSTDPQAASFGGVTGGDSACQSRATAAALGGTWKAIISGITEPTAAINRVGYNWTELRLVDNTTVVAYAGGLWQTLLSPIIKDEFGVTRASTRVLSGTASNGMPYSYVADLSNIRNWTGGTCSATYMQGNTSALTAAISQGYWLCQTDGALFCIEQ